MRDAGGVGPVVPPGGPTDRGSTSSASTGETEGRLRGEAGEEHGEAGERRPFEQF